MRERKIAEDSTVSRSASFSVQCVLFNSVIQVHDDRATRTVPAPKKGTPTKVHDALFTRDLSPSFPLTSLTSCTRYFLLAGLSYGARKHAQIPTRNYREREVIQRAFILRASRSATRTSNIEWNRFYVNYEFASRPSGRHFAKRRILSTLSVRAVISAVPKVTSTSTGSYAFQWVLPVPRNKSSHVTVQRNSGRGSQFVMLVTS